MGIKPDYGGGSIVNLMGSIGKAFGAMPASVRYPELRALPAKRLRGRRVVLLVVDGLGHDWLRGHGKKSFLARHLAGRMTSVFPSTTGAAMTSLYTGVAPQQHGLTGWFVNFKELGMTVAPLPGRARGGGLELPGIDYRLLVGSSSFASRLLKRSTAIFPEEYRGSGYNDAMTAGATERPYGTMEELFAALRAALRGRSRFVMAYWPDYDAHGHRFGVGHRRTLRHFAALDRQAAAFAASLPEGTTLIVSADHGMVDTPRVLDLKRHPTLAACLSAPLAGDARIGYCYVHPGKEREFRRYVKTRLRGACALRKSADLVRDGWFGRGREHPMLRHRVGDYALLMKPGWMIRDSVLGEARKEFVGNHSGATRAEMLVPLVVVEK